MSKLVDNIIALRILKMLVTPFKDTDAYKLGIVDDQGKLLRNSKTFKTEQEYDAYDYLTRFVFNIKRLLNKIGQESVLKSVAAALYLIRENTHNKDLDDETLEHMFEFVMEHELYESQLEYVSRFLKEDGEGAGAGVQPITTTKALPYDKDTGMPTAAIRSDNKYVKHNKQKRKRLKDVINKDKSDSDAILPLNRRDLPIEQNPR